MPKVIARLGDDVSTDVIYPGRYMATVLPSETPQYAFANDPELNATLRSKELPKGSVIVAGKNFGCGSSREQAVSTLTGSGVTIGAGEESDDSAVGAVVAVASDPGVASSSATPPETPSVDPRLREELPSPSSWASTVPA